MPTRASLFAAAILLLGAATPATVAAQGQGPVTTPGPQSHETQIGAAKGAQRVFIQTSNSATNYTSNSFVQVTGMSFNIPKLKTGILVATFTAESACSGGSWCSVRIVCDGVELLPNSGADFAFNSPGGATWTSLSVTRRSGNVAGGSHFCEVETAQVGASNHRLDDWTFVVEFWEKN